MSLEVAPPDPSALPNARQRLRLRRNRCYPRVVKRRVSKWPKKQARHWRPPQPTNHFADSVQIA